MCVCVDDYIFIKIIFYKSFKIIFIKDLKIIFIKLFYIFKKVFNFLKTFLFFINKSRSLRNLDLL
jgi:hypothetical protein